MTREQHIAASKFARLQALKNRPVHGTLTLEKNFKSASVAVNQAIR